VRLDLLVQVLIDSILILEARYTEEGSFTAFLNLSGQAVLRYIIQCHDSFVSHTG
jgi:hypothetical protein